MLKASKQSIRQAILKFMLKSFHDDKENVLFLKNSMQFVFSLK